MRLLCLGSEIGRVRDNPQLRMQGGSHVPAVGHNREGCTEEPVGREVKNR